MAQIPVGFGINGLNQSGFTWNGTMGEYVVQEQKFILFRKYTTIRLFFAENGLTLGNLKIQLIEEIDMDKARNFQDDN